METTALILSSLALLLALAAWLRSGGHAKRIEDLEEDIRRRVHTASEETDQKLQTQGKLLVRVANGQTVDAAMIKEGRLWRDILTDEGQAMIAKEPTFVLDVRTVSETASGMLPGAVHIPVGELEERFRELPRDGQAILIYCASGGRSAAACEFLSREGFEELSNLAGGIGAWRGPIERPDRS